ncbi:MAG: hypothetical protein R3D00_30605 [Bacteroidia bacterium]
MKSRTILLLISVVLLSRNAFGQRESTFPILIAKTDLLSWAAIERPAFFAGLEYRPIPVLAVEAEYGFELPLYPWGNPPETIGRFDYDYGKLRMGLNVHPGYRFRYVQSSIGFQFFYHPESYTRFGSWYWRDGEQWSYERADIVVKSVGWNINGGLHCRLGEKVVMQFFAGMGPKRVSATHQTLNEQPFTPNAGPLDFNFDFGRRDQVKGVERRVHIYWAVKLGFVILNSDKTYQNWERPSGQRIYNRYRKPIRKI